MEYLDPITYRNWRLVKYTTSIITANGILLILFGALWLNVFMLVLGLMLASLIVIIPLRNYHSTKKKENENSTNS